jgi:hypothetical protein
LTGPVSVRALESQFNSRFGPAASSAEIEQQMLNAGSGAGGIISGSRGPNEAGRVFNVINQNGSVRFLDGQTGVPSKFGDWHNFHLLMIN